MKRYYLVLPILVIVLVGGFFVPLGSRSAPHDICLPADAPVVTIRRRLIFGETLKNIPNQMPDYPFYAEGIGGCLDEMQVEYVLYIF